MKSELFSYVVQNYLWRIYSSLQNLINDIISAHPQLFTWCFTIFHQDSLKSMAPAWHFEHKPTRSAPIWSPVCRNYRPCWRSAATRSGCDDGWGERGANVPRTQRSLAESTSATGNELQPWSDHVNLFQKGFKVGSAQIIRFLRASINYIKRNEKITWYDERTCCVWKSEPFLIFSLQCLTETFRMFQSVPIVAMGRTW